MPQPFLLPLRGRQQSQVAQRAANGQRRVAVTLIEDFIETHVLFSSTVKIFGLIPL